MPDGLPFPGGRFRAGTQIYYFSIRMTSGMVAPLPTQTRGFPMRYVVLTFMLFAQCVFAQEAIFVGIAGGSGSGKTRLAKRLADVFAGDAILLEQDSYYRDQSHLKADAAKVNFDHPDSLEFSLLAEHLRILKNGSAIEKPIYDFKTHSRRPGTIRVEPAKIVIVEGILLLAVDEVRDLFDVKIFVDAEDDIRILRRLTRDTSERGRTVDGVIAQYQATVKPMHDQFVATSKKHAHVIVPSVQNTDVAEEMVVSLVKARLNKETECR